MSWEQELRQIASNGTWYEHIINSTQVTDQQTQYKGKWIVNETQTESITAATNQLPWPGFQADQIPFLTSNDAVEVTGGANDTLAGTGAQKTWVIGMDSAYRYIAEEVDNAGAAKATTTLRYITVAKMLVSQAGSSGWNEAPLAIQSVVANHRFGSMLAIENQSFGGVIPVAADYRFYCKQITLRDINTLGIVARIAKRDENGLVTTLATYEGGNNVDQIIPVHEFVNEKSVVFPWIYGDGDTVGMTIEGYLEYYPNQ